MKFNADIATLISEIEDLSTLSKAVSTTELVHTLKGTGPLTLFAPDNDAFSKILANFEFISSGTREHLLDEKAKLTAILAYHVVPGKYLAADVGKYKTVKSLHGSAIEVHEQYWLRHGVRINDAAIKEADLECTNGVIQVIDAVLIPR